MSSDDTVQLGRLIAFSDGVIAIAITLLAFQVTPPDMSNEEVARNFLGVLAAMAPAIAGFLQSFLVIGIYWMVHHRLFQYIKRYDYGLLWINLLFLLTVSFLPVPSIFLIRFLGEPKVMFFYLLCMICTGGATWLLWRYASHRYRLVDKRLTPQFIRWVTVRAIIAPVVALVSIVLYFLNQYAVYTFAYLVLITFGLLPRLYREPPVYRTDALLQRSGTKE